MENVCGEGMREFVDIYRSSKKEGLYLFVKKGQNLAQLPEALMTQFGKAEFSMSLLLTPEKKLARAEPKEVLQSLQDKLFYLQMPPSEFELKG